MKKICSKCGKELDLNMFGKKKSSKNGLSPWCKECCKISNAKSYSENKEKILEQQKQKYLKLHPIDEIEDGYKKCGRCGKTKPLTSVYFGISSKNKDGLKHTCKECRKQNEYIDKIDSIKIIRKKYYEENKEKIETGAKIYRLNHKNKNQKYKKAYYEENKSNIKEKVRKNALKRRHTDISYKLLCYYRTRIYQALKGRADKTKTTRALIGCSIEELKEHLRKQFLKGMTWENYGDWHVDHIKPCASFNLHSEIEQEECFNYLNLQPLWAIDNLKKSSTYNK